MKREKKGGDKQTHDDNDDDTHPGKNYRTNEQKIGGFRGLGGPIYFLEQYAKRIVITNYHTKFQLNSSKRLEVIPA